MGIFDRQNKNEPASKINTSTPVITIDSIHRGLDYLVELVNQIRTLHLPGKFFFRYPKDFILPPKYPRQVDEVRMKLSRRKDR